MGTAPLVRAADEGEKTLTGEVVDTLCFAAMGAKGASHKQCAIACAQKGIPVGLLEQGTNKVPVLLPNKDKTALPDNVINKMGDTTTITGKSYTTGGTTFLMVESVK
jgi:hypothetical protein